ncbi:MAG: ABC transporter ATP-binding protein, partial [Mycobacterium sp.]
RALRMLGLVGLPDKVDAYPGELSGGQQQRVAIARAIVKQPPLLLCDEPTGSLDLVTGRQVLAALRDLARNGQHTVVVVTHNSEIARMADRILWLHSGAISKTETIESPVDASELDW